MDALTPIEIRFLHKMAEHLGNGSPYPLYFGGDDIKVVEQLSGIKMPASLKNRFKKSSGRMSLAEQVWRKAGISIDTESDPEEILVASENENLPSLETGDFGESFFNNPTVFIPKKDATYVANDLYFELLAILDSNVFYPTWIWGESGFGKTLAVEQACATLGIPLVVADISPSTDETSLLGGWQLRDGETVWVNGVASIAMYLGAVLLLDEIDRASSKAMCLQPVLSRKPVYTRNRKKIEPNPSFKVIATANTNGRGDATGRYIGANPMNVAFRDRFDCTLHQRALEESIELEIIRKNMDLYGINDEQWAANLVAWASHCRKNFTNGVIDENLSTRRLVSIVKGFAVTGNKQTAMSRALEVFDITTKEALLQFYNLVAVPGNSGSASTPSNSATPRSPRRWS